MTYQEPTAQLSPQDEALNQALNQLRDALIQAGLYPEQADELLGEYDHERIGRQLAWLPYRGARSPAGMLMAAIRGAYEMPPAVRPNPVEPSSARLAETASGTETMRGGETTAETAALDIPYPE